MAFFDAYNLKGPEGSSPPSHIVTGAPDYRYSFTPVPSSTLGGFDIVKVFSSVAYNVVLLIVALFFFSEYLA